TGWTFRQRGDKIIVLGKDEVPGPEEPATAPPGLITGRITDINGAPLAGVNIQVKGTSTGVQSNLDGRFSINAAPGAVLVISSVGYETQEVPIRGNAPVAITLKD